MRVCPGRYRIADPTERGVIVAAASGTRIDLTGVVLESGDSVPGALRRDRHRQPGRGRRVRRWAARSAATAIGLRLEGGAGPPGAAASTLSGSRATAAALPDPAGHADRLDPWSGWLEHSDRGGGRARARAERPAPPSRASPRTAAQNGIGLIDARGSLRRGQRRPRQHRLGHPPLALLAQHHHPQPRCSAPCGARPRRPTATPPRSCSARAATRTRSPRTISRGSSIGALDHRSVAAHPGLGRQPGLPERRLAGAGVAASRRGLHLER